MTFMVKRKIYSQEYKQKLVIEILSGASVASISRRESITPATLNRWKQEYLDGTDVDKVDKKELVELRKKLADLSVLLAEVMLENEILKKTEKILQNQKRKELLSKPISLSSLGLRKASKP